MTRLFGTGFPQEIINVREMTMPATTGCATALGDDLFARVACSKKVLARTL
eukprot:CAMPEP_0115717764 /NCGR_PEP_ID=MMETSP0272-20121206/77047_1 /TAXON_ID=71861 /ORGANISM="Scrippsiella trochoidea, Strain CCMP3099" /LENGTH=50 /DNA_ID=CAMNT_0003160199 /DNA_START=127 /DNA_END=276 /DNA_ORIENTATION=-